MRVEEAMTEAFELVVSRLVWEAAELVRHIREGDYLAAGAIAEGNSQSLSALVPGLFTAGGLTNQDVSLKDAEKQVMLAADNYMDRRAEEFSQQGADLLSSLSRRIFESITETPEDDA